MRGGGRELGERPTGAGAAAPRDGVVRRLPHAKPDRWTSLAWARLAAVLRREAGLHFPPRRRPGAERAMRRAMKRTGERDPARFAARAAADPRVFALVIAETTSGETCFFRETAQLDYLRRAVLPQFDARRRSGRPPRLWSAGCATGEEAYSLAILLREAGWADHAMVLGTDLSRSRLEAARRAHYDRWSLRAVPHETVARWFSRRGAHYQVVPAVRGAVTFREHNLAAGDWPDGDSGIANMDVVLCRHVLVYLDHRTVVAVAERLLRALAPEGWLFLGGADPPLQELVSCEVVATGAGVAYRRAGARASGADAASRPTLPAATTPSGGPAA